MDKKELKNRALALGIEPGKRGKREIILEIQRVEGNTACFGENDGSCTHDDCCWRDDCAVEHQRSRG